MCPSFSLCACRILKIRSCLRSPLAPGSSRDRAILVSSVIFFSFSSAMVIFTYGVFLRVVIFFFFHFCDVYISRGVFSGGGFFIPRGGDGLLSRGGGPRGSCLK